jgi:amidase
MCFKDMYDMKGQPTTIGYLSWHNEIAEKDSTVVNELRIAGAVMYCKTTMPQTGMALETNSNLWGRTLNPYNSSLASGGSSGGDGALIAMRGSPISPSSDIGGSIRAPAAFNGLYSIRPSSERIPKFGMRSTIAGNVSIKTSSGPIAHSVADLNMFTKILNAYPNNRFEPGMVPLMWKELPPFERKLSFGLFEFDGVCMPHPPILRAMKEVSAKLIAAGHEGI